MKPITDLTGALPKGTNPYLPTGVGKIKSVSWCQLTDNNGTPLRNDAGEEYRPVLCLELEGRGFFRVPRLTPRYTESLTPIDNRGEVLDLIRQALDTTSTYEEVVSKLSNELVGKTISVTRTPQKLITSDLKPYVGSVVTVELAKEQAQSHTTVAPAAAAQ